MSASGTDIKKIAAELLCPDAYDCSHLPKGPDVVALVESLLGIFFPHFADRHLKSAQQMETAVAKTYQDLEKLLEPLARTSKIAVDEIAGGFLEELPSIRSRLAQDAEAILRGDPAAQSVDEVILAYPGFFAIATFRIAHELHRLKTPLLPRMITEHAHQRTGIDIHPGATIGDSFFIDHGTGIVIGETTVIRNNVKLYQGVTLGPLSVEKTMASQKRHPTIEDDVVIYSNATILGGETVIGRGSVIGGNVWITASVPPGSKVYHQGESKVR